MLGVMSVKVADAIGGVVIALGGVLFSIVLRRFEHHSKALITLYRLVPLSEPNIDLIFCQSTQLDRGMV